MARDPFTYSGSCEGNPEFTIDPPEELLEESCETPDFEEPNLIIRNLETSDLEIPPTPDVCVYIPPDTTDPNAYYNGQWAVIPKGGWDKSCGNSEVTVSGGIITTLSLEGTPQELELASSTDVAVPGPGWICIKYQITSCLGEPLTWEFGWHTTPSENTPKWYNPVPDPIAAAPPDHGPSLIKVLATVGFDDSGCLSIAQEQHGPIEEGYDNKYVIRWGKITASSDRLTYTANISINSDGTSVIQTDAELTVPQHLYRWKDPMADDIIVPCVSEGVTGDPAKRTWTAINAPGPSKESGTWVLTATSAGWEWIEVETFECPE